MTAHPPWTRRNGFAVAARKRRSADVHHILRVVSGAFEQVHEWVRRIPVGHVMSYGQISKLMDRRLTPLAVGWAMKACPEDVPWHRVVNAQGGCSTDGRGDSPPGYQRALLESEGVVFGGDGTLDMERYRFEP